ncbi:uncharacterized protein LOC143221530 [Lasioglossum baleicum]|uniref:uncharacterized protein LOC143221530 n=1 Tax=Lasioglossum baleicum TaxID=434251 RepID=UPI003FCEDEE1
MASRKRGARLASVWSSLAIRVVWGYHSLSHEAASILAGLLPLDLLAGMQARTYDHVRRRPSWLPSLGPEEADNIKEEIRRSGLEEWRRRLSRQACLRHRAVGAIVPVLDARMKSGGRRTFRLTQVLSGHGCFGQYLNNIGREVTHGCWFCDAEVDTAQQTLKESPAWTAERRARQSAEGWDLSVLAIVPNMVEPERNWRAVASFCEQVMLQMDAAERGLEEGAQARSRSGRRFRRARRRLT